MSDVKLGYIGLGNQGLPMAKRLVNWPGGLIVFDVRTEAMTPLAEAGANLADSVADVAKADVISVTVLTDAQVRDVVAELAAHAEPGTVIAIHSTIDPQTAGELAEQLQAMGYALEAQSFNGDVQMIRIDGTTPEPAADPRGIGVGRVIR
jgi:3-hydroxyisobutyrate dehydrogenase-like beta-hydroxyacid dehydrogenase